MGFLPPPDKQSDTGGRRAGRVPRLGSRPGACLLWRSDDAGWTPPPLHLANPVLILRVNRQGTRVTTPEGELVASHDDRTVTPFRWIDEILKALSEGATGTERRLFRSPVFPIAMVAASYEFGRNFQPHEHAFPHADASEVDDLFVSFHSTGFALREERWSVVGRPPSRDVRWRDWSVPPGMTDWPRPPLLGEGPPASSDSIKAGVPLPPVPSLDKAAYMRAVNEIHEHLRAGNIYQANLTVRFEGRTLAQPDAVFSAGLAASGERFAACLRTPDGTHVSFSPELFVRRWGRNITTRPIKGTRPRPPIRNAEIAARELYLSPKDRAEHVMIVDLERNDLGRLCEYGTVRVDPFLDVSWHPTVIHLESGVSGTLRNNVGLREIFAALFPGGSITGAPKRRALEIIGQLEPVPRGLYCGALGWVDHRGDCEFNLPIRTATFRNDGRFHLYSGCGIVADSEPEAEWNEMKIKLRFMEEALANASRSVVPAAT